MAPLKIPLIDTRILFYKIMHSLQHKTLRKYHIGKYFVYEIPNYKPEKTANKKHSIAQLQCIGVFFLSSESLFATALELLTREDMPVLYKHLLPDDFPNDLRADAEQLGDGGVRVVEAVQQNL